MAVTEDFAIVACNNRQLAIFALNGDLDDQYIT